MFRHVNDPAPRFELGEKVMIAGSSDVWIILERVLIKGRFIQEYKLANTISDYRTVRKEEDIFTLNNKSIEEDHRLFKALKDLKEDNNIDEDMIAWEQNVVIQDLRVEVENWKKNCQRAEEAVKQLSRMEIDLGKIRTAIGSIAFNKIINTDEF